MPCLVAGSKPASQLLLNINRQTYETPVKRILICWKAESSSMNTTKQGVPNDDSPRRPFFGAWITPRPQQILT